MIRKGKTQYLILANLNFQPTVCAHAFWVEKKSDHRIQYSNTQTSKYQFGQTSNCFDESLRKINQIDKGKQHTPRQTTNSTEPRRAIDECLICFKNWFDKIWIRKNGCTDHQEKADENNQRIGMHDSDEDFHWTRTSGREVQHKDFHRDPHDSANWKKTKFHWDQHPQSPHQ